MASKSTAAPRAAFGPVLVVDGEEGGEAVGGVLLQAGKREVQLVDVSV
jgi:hypothetical protein